MARMSRAGVVMPRKNTHMRGPGANLRARWGVVVGCTRRSSAGAASVSPARQCGVAKQVRLTHPQGATTRLITLYMYTGHMYTYIVIASFADPATQDIYDGE